MEIIQSKDNKIYKQFIKLSSKKFRDKENQYIIEGENLVEDGIEMGNVVYIGLIEKAFENLSPKLRQRINESEIPLAFFKDSLFKKISQTDTPQGVIGISRKNPTSIDDFFTEIEPKNTKLVVLDKVQDPGNVGSIIRTANATGYGVAIIKGSADIYSPKVVRATMGALFRVPIVQIDSYKQLIEQLKKRNVKSIGTSMEAKRKFYEEPLGKSIAIIVGNEGNGVDPVLAKECDTMVSIPMEPGIESLNVAVAAAITMYQGYREHL